MPCGSVPAILACVLTQHLSQKNLLGPEINVVVAQLTAVAMALCPKLPLRLALEL